MKIFLNLKGKIYPTERLNTSNGVIRNKELFLDTPEEIQTALRKQLVWFLCLMAYQPL